MLTTQGLVSGYGKVRIINDVSLEVKKGEIVSIIGRNGVGKTTLMKTIMGVLKPMAGQIRIGGRDFTKLPVHARARSGIGYVEQGHGIFPDLTVEENIQVGLAIHNRKRHTDFSETYQYFPVLANRGKQKAGTLSGGEQAMLSIARVLVARPDMIILDEPSEGVQPNVIMQIGEIIREYSRDMGVTILIVEQHLKLIQHISQRAYAIDKGMVVGEMTREQLLDHQHVTSYLCV